MDNESKLLAEIQQLKEDKAFILDTIATWANQEGIGFDQTTRLSRMLGLEEEIIK